MDTALIDQNEVKQVWIGTTIENLNLPEDFSGELVEFETGAVIAGMFWDGSVLLNPPAPPPTAKDVNTERDRRQQIAVPVQVDISTNFYVDVDDKSRTFILAVTEMANIISSAGSPDQIDFTGADNITRSLTPDAIRLMSVQVFQELARIQAKAREIKNMNPIPANFKDDAHWT
jgi:hypothetical protein